MKCPYCNQEHPEGTKYCPETGQKMPTIVVCMKKDCPNYGRCDLPASYKFCPECGEPLYAGGITGLSKAIQEKELSESLVLDKKEQDNQVPHTVLFVLMDNQDDSTHLRIYSKGDNKPIYEGTFEEREIRIESENGHDVLYLGGGWRHEKYDRISYDGMIERGLDWEYTHMSSMFTREDPGFDPDFFMDRHPQYENVEEMGYYAKDNIYLIRAYNDNFTDVLTTKGRLLFRGNHIFPTDFLSEGYFVVEDDEGNKGLWNMSGREILPCRFRDIEEATEEQTGIIVPDFFKVRDEDGIYSINIRTKEKYNEITKDFYVRFSNDDEYVTLINRRTKNIVLNQLDSNGYGNRGPLPDGFYHVACGESDATGWWARLVLAKDEKCFNLDLNEWILRMEWDSPYLNGPEMISENRIITYKKRTGSDNSICPQNFDYIRIRDYTGHILQTIQNPDIWPLHSYRYGKILAFKMRDDKAVSLAYIDNQGNVHQIPFDIRGLFDKPYNVPNCYFVSENTFILHCDSDDKLMDISGNIIKDNGLRLEELAEGFLLYEEDDPDYSEVEIIDPHGNFIIAGADDVKILK